MTTFQLTPEWVDTTLNPSIARFMYIHAAVNKMAEDNCSETGTLEPKEVLYSALQLPLMGLNPILGTLNNQLQNRKFLGGNNPNEVDQKAFLSIYNAVSKNILKLTKNEVIEKWYKRCKTIYLNDEN